MTEPTQAVQVVDWKDAEIQKFTEAIDPQALQELADQFKELTIKDHTDKEGYNKVYDARQILKKKRVFIEKEGKRLRDATNSFNKMVISKEGKLVSIVRIQEDRLQEEEDRYEAERERIRLEEKKKEDARIQAMINKLNAVEAAVDFATLKGMTDEQFQEYLAEATEAYNAAIEKRVSDQEAEEKRQQEAMAELKRQQEAIRIENERLAKVKAEQDAQAAQLKAQQEAINREKQAIEDAKRKADEAETKRLWEITNQRLNALAQYGVTDTNQGIGTISQDDFDKMLADAKEAFEIKKAKEEKERKEEELRAMEDGDRFAFLAQKIDVHFLMSSVWTNFKSKSGKNIAFTLRQNLMAAKELCAANSSNRKVLEIPEGTQLD